MGLNSTEVSYGFGQMGSAYLADTGAYEPPAGKVIVSIQILDDATKFALLTADTSGYVDLGDTTPGTIVQGATGYIGTATPVTIHGTNADAIGTSTTFKAGLNLVGRWTAVTLGAGSVIMYLADVR